MHIKKRSGQMAKLAIEQIQKHTAKAVNGLDNVSQSELELDAQLKFYDGMHSSEIQDALIATAVEKIDIDKPNWTFVAARLFLYDLYHTVGRTVKSKKGTTYGPFENYIQTGIEAGKLVPTIADGYNIVDLGNYLKPERDLQFQYLGIKTLYDRYLIKNGEGKPIELPQQMFMGVAMFLAQNEEDKQTKAKEFYDVISKFEVMLATPTLSNARTNRHQLSSCYIGSSPDNIEGIFDAYKEQALLSKFGGGIGWDWNLIRSSGGSIDNNPKAAGGVVPFLKIDNDIAIAVDQLGTRKGAIAVYLEPWHADIEDFIDLKKNSGEERRRAHDLFPALWIGDDFMEAVLTDSNWDLRDPAEPKKVVKTVKAKALWKKILTSYFESGSPFLCFKDTANRANPNPHVGQIRSSNLCTEIFQNTEPDSYLVKLYDHQDNEFYLPETAKAKLASGHVKLGNKLTSLDTIVAIENLNPKDPNEWINLTQPLDIYCTEKERIAGKTAVCNLASVNLSKVNTKEDIARVVPIAIRMLDNVIDLNFYPLKKVKDTNMQSRAIGLGYMGEAQMLAERGVIFGTQTHLNTIDEIGELISYHAIQASADLAIERGAYPDFEGSNWSKGVLPHHHATDEVWQLTDSRHRLLDEWIKLADKIEQTGVRNGYMMAVAPTSSISILVGTTQAIEPVYKRKWYEENLSGQIPVVAPNLNPSTWAAYVPAYEVDQMQIIKAAAVRQKWIDQGQSTNIFMSLDKASGKYLHELYTTAWRLGLKSTYYLRSQSPEAVDDTQDRSQECVGCQ